MAPSSDWPTVVADEVAAAARDSAAEAGRLLAWAALVDFALDTSVVSPFAQGF